MGIYGNLYNFSPGSFGCGARTSINLNSNVYITAVDGASDIANTKSFTLELLNEFNSMNQFKTYLFDTSNQISENYQNIVKYTTKCDKVLTSVNDNINKIYQEYEAAGFDSNLASGHSFL